MDSKYLLPGIKVVVKLRYLVATIGGLVTAQLPSIARFMTKQNSIWSKALSMPLTIWNCALSYKQKNYFSENKLVLLRNYFHNRISRQQLLLPTFLTGSKWDFQGANSLLATINFELKWI